MSAILLGVTFSVSIMVYYYIINRINTFKSLQFVSGTKVIVYWSSAYLVEWLFLNMAVLLLTCILLIAGEIDNVVEMCKYIKLMVLLLIL